MRANNFRYCGAARRSSEWGKSEHVRHAASAVNAIRSSAGEGWEGRQVESLPGFMRATRFVPVVLSGGETAVVRRAFVSDATRPQAGCVCARPVGAAKIIWG